MTDPADLRDPHCPTCGQPLRHGGRLQAENASLVRESGNAGITFETQGRCENEACADFGSELAPDEWLEPVARVEPLGPKQIDSLNAHILAGRPAGGGMTGPV